MVQLVDLARCVLIPSDFQPYKGVNYGDVF